MPATGRSPRLIDPAEAGDHHWAADTARLCVDMMCSAWDAGIASHKWDRVVHWRALAKAFALFQELPAADTDANTRVRSALGWFHSEHQRIFCGKMPKAAPGWEFQLALAVEFMRASYRQDLSTPKNVLGMVAGYDAFAACQEALGNLVGAS